MKPNLAALIICAVTLAGVGHAQAADRVEVGVLDCTVEGGTGFIFGSTKDLSCTFDPVGESRARESYFGEINKFGIDIGKTERTVIKWGVLAPTTDDYQPGALAGNYTGVSGEATVGVGLGANVLVGGSSETIVLQPISVQAQEGLNVALGVAQIELRAIAD